MRVLIATRNRHKIEEIRSILGDGFDYVSLDNYRSAPVPDETGTTFAANATIKAVTLANWLAATAPGAVSFVLADDSGLEVDALGGAPGVHSARFAALDTGASGNSPDAENNAKLLHLLAAVPEASRSARFRCAIAWTPVPACSAKSASAACDANEAELATSVFEGTCEGKIAAARKGSGGFGYDPYFVPLGYEQTFAQLGDEIKNRLSHRAAALQKLRQFLKV